MIQDIDELVDLVDNQDIIAQVQWRSKIHEHPQLHARAVLAFIVNERGQLCFFRRAAHKSYAPNQWALVGGCVQSGETYEQAIIREIAEEVNVVVSPDKMKFLGRVTPVDYPGKFFKGIFEIKIDQEMIPFNADDFSELVWLTPEQLKEAAQSDPSSLVQDLLFLVERYYL
jgi:isopentenyl-diphosphate delta-isomerase